MKADTGISKERLSRKELIRLARREFNSRPEAGFSFFKFHEPEMPGQVNEGNVRMNESLKASVPAKKKSGEILQDDCTDTLMARIILTTALFLLLFFMSRFELVPDFGEQLKTVISDNSIVETMYDFVNR